jgi:hypothetical protein
MDPARTPKPLAFLPTAFVLVLLGFGGIALLVNFTVPTIFPRWLLFFLIVCGFSGLGLPLMAFLNNRFPSNPPARIQAILRQSIWVGAYVATLAWLQFGRVLGFALAFFMALIFVAIEWLFRTREKNLNPF